MTVGTIIQRIQSLYSKGVHSDDSRLTNRHIYNKMLTLRSKLITQKLKKRQKISDWNFSVLKCVEVIKVDAHECPCLPQVGCQVYRTKLPLPQPLHDMNKHIIQWVMSVEHSILIDESTRKKELWVKGQRFTNKKRRYITENGYLYFYGDPIGSAVSVKLLAQDPVEVQSFRGICDTTEQCVKPLDTEFPIDGDLIEDLVTMAVPELVQVFSGMSEDMTNNTKDSVPEQSK